MARINLLQQASVLKHDGEYTIGYAISNNDFIKLENCLISADGVLSDEDANETNLNARATIKRLLESLDKFKMWKNEELKKQSELGKLDVPSSLFLTLPNAECMVDLRTKTDDDKPSQILQFTLAELKGIAKALRISYEIVTDFDKFSLMNNMTGLLESFESFISAMEGENNG